MQGGEGEAGGEEDVGEDQSHQYQERLEVPDHQEHHLQEVEGGAGTKGGEV
jgi:hypothetical protein